MGSSGTKKRRKCGGKPQHLPKVGTHNRSAAARSQQRERQAVLDTMGLGGLGPTGRAIAWAVFAVMAVVAVVALLYLIVF